MSGSDVTVEKINEAFNTGDYVTVTLTANADANEEISPIKKLYIPENKTLVVETELYVAESVESDSTSDSTSGSITVNSGGELVINEGGLLNNSGTLENYGTFTNNGTFTNSGKFTNSGTFTNSETGTFTNSGTLDNTGTINNSGSITNDGTITDTGEGIILKTGSKLTNSGKITGSGDRVIFLEGGTLILGGIDGSSGGSIENTEKGFAIAVNKDLISTIRWLDTTIKIYSIDLEHAIQGLTEGTSDDNNTIVVPSTVNLSPSEGLVWNGKMLYFEQ